MVIAGDVSRPGVAWPTHLPGLVGPALAAVVVTALTLGRTGLADLGSRVTRWRVGWGWWALVVGTAAIAPLGAAARTLAGEPFPDAVDFARYTGLGEMGLVPVVALALVVNGLGEEAGWRGFAAERLLRTRGITATSLLVAAAWAVWHLPLFWVVESFRAMSPASVVGWLVGLTAGSVALTWIYAGSGRSVLLVAAWHTAFNLTSATDATSGVGAAVSSTLVMVGAVAIVVRERRRGRPAGAVPSSRAPRA